MRNQIDNTNVQFIKDLFSQKCLKLRAEPKIYEVEEKRKVKYQITEQIRT